MDSKFRINSCNRRAALRMLGLSIAGAMASGEAYANPIAPLQTEFVYEALVTLEPAVQIGPSADGTRRYIPITGGTFSGPKIRGAVLPGGADWQVDRPDGAVEVNALYSIKTDDGAVIVVQNRGIIAGAYFKTIPEFKAPLGPYGWLNQSIFVGSVAGSPHPGAVIVRVFRVI